MGNKVIEKETKGILEEGFNLRQEINRLTWGKVASGEEFFFFIIT